jgi:hypothetical protein
VAEVGDVVRREEVWGVVVAKKKGKRAVRWEPLWRGAVTVHEPEELEVMRRLTKPARRSAPKKILEPHEEPAGFAEWLVHHVDRCVIGHGILRHVPREGTSARSDLARAFAALVEEGYELEDFKLASDGVLADEFMRAGGHTAPENVLRKTKIAKRIDEGRAWRAAQENDKYARFG